MYTIPKGHLFNGREQVYVGTWNIKTMYAAGQVEVHLRHWTLLNNDGYKLIYSYRVTHLLIQHWLLSKMVYLNVQFLLHQALADDEASTRFLQILLFLLLSIASLVFIRCDVRSSFTLSIHFFGLSSSASCSLHLST